jgi:hypothetical protein
MINKNKQSMIFDVGVVLSGDAVWTCKKTPTFRNPSSVCFYKRFFVPINSHDVTKQKNISQLMQLSNT